MVPVRRALQIETFDRDVSTVCLIYSYENSNNIYF